MHMEDQKIREDARKIMDAALHAALPDTAVEKALAEMPDASGRLILVAAGKAAWQMAAAAYRILGERIDDGIVITKHGHAMGAIGNLTIREAGHPVPDADSYNATEAALTMTAGLKETDTVLFLLSGGGSALFESPLVPLAELEDITGQLLSCGADIVEINTIRKRLSGVKGGRFAQLCAPAHVYAILLSDVTALKRAEGIRSEFTANVSHELKTPLTSISGFAELMKEGMVPKEKMQEFSGDIYRESRRLIDLVDDIIQLSRLDEGTANFAKTPVDLYVLAGGVIESLRPVAQRQNITLSLSGQHAVIQGVEQLLQEMVYNLCDNAIKYNVPGGNVAVSVWQNGPTTTLSVVDTGIGIPYADQSRVFERFYRVDKSHSKEVGGTGLGLSIVKHAAQYHGAKIELKSDPGKGTAIAVNFTAAK